MIKYLGIFSILALVLSGCPEPEEESPPQDPPKTPPQTVVDSGQSSPVETPEDSGVDPEESDPVDGGESVITLDSGMDPQPPVVDSGIDPQPPVVDSGMDPQPPVVDSGVDPQPPVVDSGIDPQPPIVDSGIDPQPPIVDSGVDPQPPVVDSGVDPPSPVVDSGVDPPSPVVDSGVDPPSPVVDSGVDPPSPVVDSGVDPPSPVVDSGVDPPSPVVDAGLLQDAGGMSDSGHGTDWGDLLDGGWAMDSGASEDAGSAVEDAGETEIICDGGTEWNGTLCADTSAGNIEVTLADVATPQSCLPLTIRMKDKNGEVNVAADVDISLSLALETLFSDDACEDALTSPPVMLAQQTSITLYWSPAQQMGAVEVSASIPAFSTGYADIFIHTESYADDERPDLPLLIYNTNDPDALDIALYYQGARDVPADRLCGVAFPRGHFASPDELMSARDQVVENCFCSLVDTGDSACSDVPLSDLLAALPVTHLVLFRGIPGRLTGTGWTNDNEDPAFDYFFSHMLAHDNYSIFVPSTDEGALDGRINIDYITSADKVGEAIDPVLHGYFALGRVEAITAERTLDLIDRTLDSEAYGFTGNFISEETPDERPYYNIGRFLTSSFAPECTDYLSHEPFIWESVESSWPDEECRWGTTGTILEEFDAGVPVKPWSGMMPGHNHTSVPYAINAGWFNGQDPRVPPSNLPSGASYLENNHSAFRNYNTLKRWRKGSTTCAPVCADEDEACRESSVDYFKVLNTDCVGFAKGFMGQQLRSWPVQYYGFFPENWKPMWGGGDSERTPPRVLMESVEESPDGGVAAENYFLRFGQASPDALNEDTCGTDDSSNPISCEERVAVNLQRTINNLNPQESFVDGDREIAVRFRYRNQGAANSKIRVKLKINNTWIYRDGESAHPLVTLVDDHLTWTDAEILFVVPEDLGDSVNKVIMQFDGRLGQKIIGFFDLDSVVAELNGRNLIDDTYSEFDVSVPTYTAHGGSASDVIDRMGGIAYWGSSSHFVTGGFAYQPRQMATRLFGGRTLGESLAVSGGKSGLIYGDPLYRGYLLRLYRSSYKGLDDHEIPQYFWTSSPQDDNSLFLDVLNGTDHTDSVLWTLASCEGTDFSSCAEWTDQLQGQGAVRSLELSPYDLEDLLGTGAHYLRLRVWVPDRPEDHLSTYAHIELTGIDFVESSICVADVTGDGIIAVNDQVTVEGSFTCTSEILEIYDINEDGEVTRQEVQACQYQNFLGCDNQTDLSYDFDESGCVEQIPDCLALEDNICTAEFVAEYDLNNDGIVNAEDTGIIEDNYGYNLCLCDEGVNFCDSAL